MNIETYTKNYGVSKLQNGRYAITIEVDTSKKYAHVLLNLSYSRLDFALKKADEFLKSMHKDFIRGGIGGTTKVVFVFNNVGLINF